MHLQGWGCLPLLVTPLTAAFSVCDAAGAPAGSAAPLKKEGRCRE